MTDIREPITVTANLANATPLRQFDWMAYRDPERAPYGYGRTEAEARADLLRQEDEDYCYTACPYERREWEDLRAEWRLPATEAAMTQSIRDGLMAALALAITVYVLIAGGLP